jgi:hypothetical protein
VNVELDERSKFFGYAPVKVAMVKVEVLVKSFMEFRRHDVM